MAKDKEQKKAESQDNGISESELIEVANSLDKIIAKPKAEGKTSKEPLPIGNYIAKILSSHLNKGKDGTIFMNFKMSVYGSLRENDNGESEIVGKMYGVHSKGFSLGNEYCVNLLLDLFRDFDVLRTDGEPIVSGGDLLRSRGIPDGTWVIATVRTAKNGSGKTFISGLYKPPLRLIAQAKGIYEKFCALNSNNVGDDYEPDTTKGTDEPPF